MSTHPPLEQRIRLLDPSFQGELPRGQLQPVAVDEEIPVVAAAVQSERGFPVHPRSEEHTSELQSQSNLVCRLLLEKKKKNEPRRPNLSGVRGPKSVSITG